MSLLEILVVVALVGLASTALGFRVHGHYEDQQHDETRDQALQLEQVLLQYRAKHGRYPSASDGLGRLVAPPRGASLVDQLPQDVWGRAFTYRNPGVMNPRGVDVVSAGPDGIFDTDDDLGNWPPGQAAP